MACVRQPEPGELADLLGYRTTSLTFWRGRGRPHQRAKQSAATCRFPRIMKGAVLADFWGAYLHSGSK